MSREERFKEQQAFLETEKMGTKPEKCLYVSPGCDTWQRGAAWQCLTLRWFRAGDQHHGAQLTTKEEEEILGLLRKGKDHQRGGGTVVNREKRPSARRSKAVTSEEPVSD
ncbi:Hypothetical predicted protein [Xyrichtys novacula]|uniref:Uncharacterized protein n=1 Tax=Xyrichtys novacula TaxID=13765 RepID=A0AAV1EZQ4_XYRNO|nr:Hypothetical predicted protein [Xyrichtys novacula]